MKASSKRILFMIFLAAILALSCALPASIGNKLMEIAGNPVMPGEETASSTESAIQPDGSAAPQSSPGVPEEPGLIDGSTTSMPDNHRSELSLDRNGTDSSGNTITLTIRMRAEVNRTQSISHTVMQSEGSGGEGATNVEIYRQDDQSYLYSADDAEYPYIPAGSSGAELSAYLYTSPEDFLGQIKPGELIESGVAVNGILTDHYSVRSTGMDINDISQESGEIWIAQTDDYIVRYLGQAKGEVTDGTHSGGGTLQWEYNLYDTGQVGGLVALIDLPVECRNQQEVMEDVPIPDNALKMESFGGIITFGSPDSPEQIGDFYRARLPGLGWMITEDSVESALVMMTAEQGKHSLQIMVTAESSAGSSVIINSIAFE